MPEHVPLICRVFLQGLRAHVQASSMSVSDKLLTLPEQPTVTLAEAFGVGTTVYGTTVLAVAESDHFTTPVQTGPTRENIASFPPSVREHMVRQLRSLADHWEQAA